MADKQSSFQLIVDVREQLSVLAFSGIAGAFLRAALAPESERRRRVIQGITGAVSAIFLGGVLGHIIDATTGAGVYSYLAAGFIMGSGGELAMKRFQERILGQERKRGGDGK